MKPVAAQRTNFVVAQLCDIVAALDADADRDAVVASCRAHFDVPSSDQLVLVYVSAFLGALTYAARSEVVTHLRAELYDADYVAL